MNTDGDEAWLSVFKQRPGLPLLLSAAAQGQAIELMRQGRIRQKDVGQHAEQFYAMAFPEMRAAFVRGDVVDGLRCIAAVYPRWQSDDLRINGEGLRSAVGFDAITLEEALELAPRPADREAVMRPAPLARDQKVFRARQFLRGIRRRQAH